MASAPLPVPGGSKTPEIREMMDWKSGKVSGLLEASRPSLFVGDVEGAAVAALPDGAGVASPDDPAGGLVVFDPPAAGGGALGN
ncbi:MAG: hypothetical protein WBE99_21035, partial [Xanthobacteraceae bacterium]